MSVKALAVAGSIAFDISDDSRASSLPVAYSSLPSGAERLAQLSDLVHAKAFCRSTGRERHLDVGNETSTVVAKVKVALSCDHHSQSLSVHKASAGVREGPARFKGPLWTPSYSTVLYRFIQTASLL